MKDELVAWLREQLDADEAAAREGQQPDLFGARSYYSVRGPHRDDWGMHTFHVPIESVLADVASKRRLLNDLAGDDASWGAQAQSERRIRVIAEAYADRPGYRDEWRPARTEA